MEKIEVDYAKSVYEVLLDVNQITMPNRARSIHEERDTITMHALAASMGLTRSQHNGFMELRRVLYALSPKLNIASGFLPTGSTTEDARGSCFVSNVDLWWFTAYGKMYYIPCYSFVELRQRLKIYNPKPETPTIPSPEDESAKDLPWPVDNSEDRPGCVSVRVLDDLNDTTYTKVHRVCIKKPIVTKWW